MNLETRSTLEQLAALDLSTYPYVQAKKLIRQLGKFCYVRVPLLKGATIMRARANSNGERFTSKSQLTYRPSHRNKTFQRASTPNRTMFYGSWIPEAVKPNELDNARLVGAFETFPWLYSDSTKGYQVITYSRWFVNEDINLIGIIHHDNFYNKSSFTRELAELYKKFVNDYPDLQEESIAIAKCFAKEFAKSKINHDYDYLLSATFSEYIVDNGFDGILYPSVRTDGQGFNVAIESKVADTKLDLILAGECSIYKNCKDIIVDNETATELEPNQTNFELHPINKQYHKGQVNCLRQLGLKSIDELKR